MASLFSNSKGQTMKRTIIALALAISTIASPAFAYQAPYQTEAEFCGVFGSVLGKVGCVDGN